MTVQKQAPNQIEKVKHHHAINCHLVREGPIARRAAFTGHSAWKHSGNRRSS
jgi:hypothetical protein